MLEGSRFDHDFPIGGFLVRGLITRTYLRFDRLGVSKVIAGRDFLIRSSRMLKRDIEMAISRHVSATESC